MKRFKKAYIEITNVCNLSCSFCAKTRRANGFISVSDFEKIVEQVSPLTDFLYFHLMGEPLLHPQLEQLLAVANAHNKRVIITTNGTLLSEKSEILLNSNAIYKVVISLHSFEANFSQGLLLNYLDDVVDFAKKASASGKIITALRLWNLSSEGETAENSLNSKIFSLLENRFNLAESISTESFSQRDLKLCERVFLQTAERFEWPDLDKNIVSEKAFCYGLRDHFAVQVDGTVVPCCLDHEGDIPLGNCLTTPLGDILDSKRALAIYDGFSQKNPVEQLCKRCGFVVKFS